MQLQGDPTLQNLDGNGAVEKPSFALTPDCDSGQAAVSFGLAHLLQDLGSALAARTDLKGVRVHRREAWGGRSGTSLTASEEK